MTNRQYGVRARRAHPPNDVARVHATNASPGGRRGAIPLFVSMFTSTSPSLRPWGLVIVIAQDIISGIDVRVTFFLVSPCDVIGGIGAHFSAPSAGNIGSPYTPVCQQRQTLEAQAAGPLALVDTFYGHPRAIHQAEQYDAYAIYPISNDKNGRSNRQVTLSLKAREFLRRVICARWRIAYILVPEDWRPPGFGESGYIPPFRPTEDSFSSDSHKNDSARIFSASEQSAEAISLDFQRLVTGDSHCGVAQAPCWLLERARFAMSIDYT